ncbi:MAG: ATP synthase F0 subunit B [Terracidiphilus sp.]
MRHSDPQARSSAWPFSIAFLAILLLAATFAVPRHAAAQQPAPASNSAASAPAANDDMPTTPNDELKAMDVFRHAPIVQSIGRKMGMDVETTARVFEAINFLIIILAIVIPIVRIVPKVLRKRSETLSQDIKTAREATADANARLSAVEARLAGLDAEIQKYRAQIEQDSLEDEKRIKATIEEESVRIVAAAEQEIAVAAAQARRGLRHFAADLAIEQAEKQLVLTPETDRALIDEFIAGAGKGGSN